MNFIKTLNIFTKFVIHGIKTLSFNKTKVKMQKWGQKSRKGLQHGTKLNFAPKFKTIEFDFEFGMFVTKHGCIHFNELCSLCFCEILILLRKICVGEI